MHIESVIAHAFGPFSNETLKLGKGMTVIHGPNESGKSTWQAALYAGLCGIRRGPGSNRENKEFRARHRPWNGEGWEVSIIIRLDDGRHVELKHDLEGKIACDARDADLGKDYSDEIMFEKSPDGSRWLGLNRRTFLSTACIRQGDIQGVQDKAEALQEHLQRAAATSGTDSTAAQAIAKINNFLRDSVGTNNRNSKKPLRAAIDRLSQLQTLLEDAQTNHRGYLELQEEIEQLQLSLNKARDALQSARKEHNRFLHETTDAKEKARNAQANLEEHRYRKPLEPSNVESGNLTAQEIRSLANDLALEEPMVDPQVDERVRLAKDKLEAMQHPDNRNLSNRTIPPLFLPFIALLRILASFFGYLFGHRKPQVDYAAIALASEELRSAEAVQGEARYQREEVRKRKTGARNKAIQARLPDQAQELVSIAEQLEQASELRMEFMRWENEEKRLLKKCEDVHNNLQHMLTAYGVPDDQDIIKAAENYQRKCEQSIDKTQQNVEIAQTALAEKRGEFEQFAKNMPSVSEAEEEVYKTEGELSRVKTLESTLKMTLELLGKAQEHVHRSLAPKLLDALRPRISEITNGRYQDVRVNVESLDVQVCGDGKNWRNANLLSRGTTEQIYLLLRVVMSRYLTQDVETCPLILDDVTVNCDPDRQGAILSFLHEISSEQQLILFSQEPEIAEWAQEHLSGDADRLINLDKSLVLP